MPRPQKGRRVCKLPINSRFSSAESGDDNLNITLTVDEYETIRLIDYVGCTQQECAKQMMVARSTVQGIYNEARRKIARFIIEATKLEISGGVYDLCERSCGICNFSPCTNIGYRRNMVKTNYKNLKIAVAYDKEQVFQNFIDTQKFKLYEINSGKIKSSKIVDIVGKGPGALTDFLQNENVTVLICGGIGGGAKKALTEARIEILAGASGDADLQVESFLTEGFSDQTNVDCSHCDIENNNFSCIQSCS